MRASIVTLLLILFLVLPGVSVVPVLSDDSTAPATSAVDSISGDLHFSAAEQDWLAQKHLVRARVGQSMPFHGSADGPHGMSVDYLDEVAKRAGFKVRYVTDIPWTDALDNLLEHRDIDLILTMTVTPERQKDFVFTKEYLLSPSVIFTRDDAPFVSSISDLYGKTIAVERGYVTQARLQSEFPNIQLVQQNTTKEAMQSLAAGHADAYTGSLTVGVYILKATGLNNVKVAAPSPFDNNNQAMGIRPDWPELASIIDKTLASLTPEQNELIRQHWLAPVRYEYGISSLDVVKWVAGISTVLLIIIVIILWWNKKLAGEIAARAIVQAKLTRSEEKYRSFYDNAWLGIFHSTPEGKFLQVNQALAEMMGYSSPEQMIFEISDIGSQLYEDSKRRYTAVAAALKHDGWVYRENRYRRRDGGIMTANLAIRKVLHPDGTVAYLEGFAEDISKRKDAEKENLLSLNRFKTVFEQVPLGFALIDSLTGRIYEVNNKYADIIGRSREELATIDWITITHPDDVQDGLDDMKRLNTGQISSYQRNKRYIKPDGSVIWVEVTVAPLQVEDTDHPRHLAMIQDITERKRAKKELDQHRDNLEGLVGKRTEELRNLVNLMSGREVRMADLKEVIQKLQTQLHDAGITPVV